jgi:hypothetical protein
LEWEIRTQHVHCTTVPVKSPFVQLRAKLDFTRKKFPLLSMLNQHNFFFNYSEVICGSILMKLISFN